MTGRLPNSMLQRLVMRARDPVLRGGSRVEPLLAARHSPTSFSMHSHDGEESSPRHSDHAGIPTTKSAASATTTPHHLLHTQIPSVTSQASFSDTASAARNADVIDQLQPRQSAPSTPSHNANAQRSSRDALAAKPSVVPVVETKLTSMAETDKESMTSDTPIRPVTEAVVRERTPEPLNHRETAALAPRHVAISPPSPAMDILQTRQEITISIGHIEIRGAPTQTAPKRAEFRPRVSLDDFLGGRR